MHATLRNALNQAVRQRLIPWNPALAVELPEERRPAVGVWSPEDVGAFLAFAADDRLYALWHVAVMCGMRRGELIGLRWRDVDLSAGQLLVIQSVTVADRCRHIGAPKTKRGNRIVALDAGTVSVLRAHRRQQLEDRLAWSRAWQDTGLVFVCEDGAMLNPDHVTRHFAALVSASGLPRITLHGLRHTCASLALAANVPVKVVSERLGPSTTTVTSNTYQHVLEAQARQAGDAIAAIVPTNVTRM